MPFVKGDTRINRGGRPKGKTKEAEIRERLYQLDDKAYNALSEALEKGSSWAVKLYYEYQLSKPKTELEINHPMLQPNYEALADIISNER